ncbi:MAG: hypothetical protein Q8J88_11975 [Bacteroidales bacterium]|nr:hypothetical protein [Bacteroidales bacterium]
MRHNTHHLLFLFLINSLVSANLFAQNNYYVLHGDTITDHKVLFQKPFMNAQWCPVYDGTEIIQYSPSEVSICKTDNSLFVSAEIELDSEQKLVFLELLAEGRIKLYAYHANYDTYYLVQKPDNSFVFLEKPKKDKTGATLREQIFDITGTDETAIYLQRIKFNNNSLISAVNRLNHPKKWYRHAFGMGIQGGVIQHQMNQSTVTLGFLQKEEFIFNPDYSFSGGLVFDIPADPLRLVISPQYTYYSFLASTRNDNPKEVIGLFTDFNLFIETKMIMMPISLRYALHAGDFALYAGGGVHTSYQIQSKTMLRTSEVTNGPGFLIAFHSSQPIETRNKLHIGLLLETGMAYKLTERNHVHLGFSYTYQFTQTKSHLKKLNHNTNQLQFSLSILRSL